MRDEALCNHLYAELWYEDFESGPVQAFMGVPLRSLPYGCCCPATMASALQSASVFVPVLSANALAKLRNLKP